METRELGPDFYLVLGIPRDADLKQIKRAYRRLVKRLHPDTSEAGGGGEKSCADPGLDRFLEVREAYDVLSDPAARADHDRLLARLERQAGRESREVHGRAARRARPAGAAVEPLAPRSPAGADFAHPLRRPERWSALDRWLGGWLPDVFGSSPGPSPAAKDLFVEVGLSQAEAACGGELPLSIPYEAPCPACGGAGCPRCRGRGWQAAHHDLSLHLPPGLADGQVHRLSLGALGLSGVELVVQIRILP